MLKKLITAYKLTQSHGTKKAVQAWLKLCKYYNLTEKQAINLIMGGK